MSDAYTDCWPRPEPKSREEILFEAIKKHHDQKADDRCHLDDSELYAAAGLEPADNTISDPEEMLKNCKRFIECRMAQGKWATYQELEKRIKDMKEALDLAWGVIANANGGNWDLADPEWVKAAERWRDERFTPLTALPKSLLPGFGEQTELPNAATPYIRTSPLEMNYCPNLCQKAELMARIATLERERDEALGLAELKDASAKDLRTQNNNLHGEIAALRKGSKYVWVHSIK